MFLADVCGANIFFWFVVCLLVFLTVSLEEQKFNFDEVEFIFSFVAFAFGVISKKSLPNPVSRSFSLKFLSKSFVTFSS